jgi:hypothetical protein
MRNIVAHDYASVDLRIVWEVAIVVGAAMGSSLAQSSLPPLFLCSECQDTRRNQFDSILS